MRAHKSGPSRIDDVPHNLMASVDILPDTPQGWLSALSAGTGSVLTGGEAAVHGERGAVDEGALVAEEKSGERGDVLL